MLARFDPFGDLDLMFDELRARRGARPMPLDAYRRGDTFFVHLDVPGIDPDSIELTIEDDVLNVKAERSFEEQEGDEIVACERPQGSFERHVYLGPNLDREHLDAHCENGVLTVGVPMREAAKRHRIPVVAGDGSK